MADYTAKVPEQNHALPIFDSEISSGRSLFPNGLHC